MENTELMKIENDEQLMGLCPDKPEKIVKKRKKCEFERVYLENLPCAKSYEKSLMHRDVINFIFFTKTAFLITSSVNGHVKFWKKVMNDIEFVKQFRAHANSLTYASCSSDGLYFCTLSSNDKTVKIFDVLNFDMINMFRLNFVPDKCCWIYKHGQPIVALSITQADLGIVRVFDAKRGPAILHQFHAHNSAITSISYNFVYDVAVSCDNKGILEYWSGYQNGCSFPEDIVEFEFKTETDLFEMVKSHSHAVTISFSHDGKKFAILTSSKLIIVFWFLSGKKFKVFDETTANVIHDQRINNYIPEFEFGRRLAVEKEMEKCGSLSFANIIFDESDTFLIVATLMGVKFINLVTNSCSRILGQTESVRFLQLTLYQGQPNKSKAVITLEMQAAENPTLQRVITDPCLICTGYKKNRFYIFSRTEPDLTDGGDTDRDILNEKPTRDEIAASTITESNKALPSSAIIYTSLGDIHVELFSKEAPKAVENFTTHAKNGYYNDLIFHRVIKQFIIQTGDPRGDGTGGESIWGREFEDEFHPRLKHDRPYTLSMANAGPNSNGSQFFVTVVATPWLDNKHTIFGRVVKGLEIVQNISQVETNEATDKPLNDIKVICIKPK